MSYVGKRPIKFSSDVTIKHENNIIQIKGHFGSAELNLPKELGILITSNSLFVNCLTPTSNKRIYKRSKALWGTYRSLINNMIVGVSRGFMVKLELVGVGYRAVVAANILSLKLGYSHDIIYNIPNDVTVECIKPTLIVVRGIDKQRVCQVASEIRKFRKPDAYKGKGIQYYGEVLKLKEGKKK